MTINELVSHLYNLLMSDRDIARPPSKEMKDQIGVLYYTKELNAPYYFSPSFTFGVYLPILSPMIFPILLSIGNFIKLKIKAKKA